MPGLDGGYWIAINPKSRLRSTVIPQHRCTGFIDLPMYVAGLRCHIEHALTTWGLLSRPESAGDLLPEQQQQQHQHQGNRIFKVGKQKEEQERRQHARLKILQHEDHINAQQQHDPEDDLHGDLENKPLSPAEVERVLVSGSPSKLVGLNRAHWKQSSPSPLLHTRMPSL